MKSVDLDQFDFALPGTTGWGQKNGHLVVLEEELFWNFTTFYGINKSISSKTDYEILILGRFTLKKCKKNSKNALILTLYLGGHYFSPPCR